MAAYATDGQKTRASRQQAIQIKSLSSITITWIKRVRTWEMPDWSERWEAIPYTPSLDLWKSLFSVMYGTYSTIAMQSKMYL